MRITEIRELAVPLSGNVANALVDFSAHTVSLVAVVSDVIRNGTPVTGVAFNSIGRFAQSGILGDRMIPRVLAAAPDTLVDEAGRLDPARILACLLRDEKPGGHGDRAAAAAAVELACWDLLAKLDDEPAYRTIARHVDHRPADAAVPVYAAGGYYYPGDHGDHVAALRAELTGYLRLGYDAVKIKIGGASEDTDLARLDAAVDVLGDGTRVAVDANGRFDRDTALNWAQRLGPYRLRWFEEPGDPLDFDVTAALAATYPGPVATGENLFSAADVVNLMRYGGMRADVDIVQMDAGLSYGLTEYLRMLRIIEEHGHHRRQAFPHGGHLINLHIAMGLGLGGCESYPGVFAPFGGYSPGCVLADGMIRPSDAPGFGLEEKPELRDWLRRLMGD